MSVTTSTSALGGIGTGSIGHSVIPSLVGGGGANTGITAAAGSGVLLPSTTTAAVTTSAASSGASTAGVGAFAGYGVIGALAGLAHYFGSKTE